MGTNGWELFLQPYRASSDATLFTSSLPVLAHEKLNLNELKRDPQSMYDASSSLNDNSLKLDMKFLEEGTDDDAVGSFLPNDEDELLSGVMDDFEASWLPNLVDDSEEYDVFGSGGGLELESDAQENLRFGVSNVSLSDGGVGNGVTHFNYTNSAGIVAGEHPLGEHPSRTLFVRNINSSVDDSELRSLFEQYGDIRALYTACKHRGFVMISYYDIRDARTAMRALQNKPLRRRKLDIHFSIPKENPSDKDMNQGTLVVFNLDPSVSNEDLLHIFGAYGEVKEIRETPYKRHHKFIEFYDVRAAEAALRALNKSDIAGKRIKLEPSRPGGARRSLLLHLNHELEQDETKLHHVGSPVGNSPPGNWLHLSSPIERNSLPNFSKSPGFSSLSSPIGSNVSGNLSSRVIYEQSSSLPDKNLSQFIGPFSSYCASTFNGSTSRPFSGTQAFWGSSELSTNSVPRTQESWGSSELSTNYVPKTQAPRHPFIPTGNNGFAFPNHHQLHARSASSVGPLERQFGYFHDSPQLSFVSPGYEGAGGSYVDKSFVGSHGSPVFHMMSPRLSPLFMENGHFPGPAVSNLEAFAERGRSRHAEINGIHIDSKKQFQLDLDKIRSGDDTRTTLMIKNIPNKYTSKMLLATIDEHHSGTYDFLYLPIDFKNKCNVGYAFINMLSPSDIVPFYEAFNGRKWEKFNSEKVAYLAYARIQGKAALVAHFQNSSLMNEDKRCRPILFDSESPESSDKIVQENGPSNETDAGTFMHKNITDQEKREQ